MGETSVNMVMPNINECSMKVLCKLPGIGKVTAQKVIDNRPYRNIEELQQIPGFNHFHYKYLVLKESLSVREVKANATVGEEKKQNSIPIMKTSHTKKKTIMTNPKMITDQQKTGDKKEKKQNLIEKKSLSKIMEKQPEEIEKSKKTIAMDKNLQNEKRFYFTLSVFVALATLIASIIMIFINVNDKQINEFPSELYFWWNQEKNKKFYGNK